MLEATVLALTAAVLHAGWNLAVKVRADRLAFLGVQFLIGGLIGLVALLVLGDMGEVAWRWAFLSGLVHIPYFLLLALLVPLRRLLARLPLGPRRWRDGGRPRRRDPAGRPPAGGGLGGHRHRGRWAGLARRAGARPGRADRARPGRGHRDVHARRRPRRPDLPRRVVRLRHPRGRRRHGRPRPHLQPPLGQSPGRSPAPRPCCASARASPRSRPTPSSSPPSATPRSGT